MALIGVVFLLYVCACTLLRVDSGVSSGLFGDPSYEFMGSDAPIRSEYHGPLPVKLVVWGKVGAACLYFLVAAPVALALSLAMCPLAPCFTLPVACCPDLPTRCRTKVLFIFVVTAATATVYVSLVQWTDINLNFGSV